MKAKLHTAEHILFTTLQNNFSVKTKALQFENDSCRVVYESMSDLRLSFQMLEDNVNSIISNDYEVKNYTLSKEEAVQIIDTSLVPDSMNEISIYEIINFNKLACIGPHVKNTQEIGVFKILKIEKKGQNIYSIKFTVI